MSFIFLLPNSIGGRMVQIRPICRNCFVQKGYSMEILLDPITGEYVCKKDPKHRYKKEEDGSFSTI